MEQSYQHLFVLVAICFAISGLGDAQLNATTTISTGTLTSTSRQGNAMTAMTTGASTSASTTQGNAMTSVTNGASTSASTTQNNAMTSMTTGAFTPASTTQGNAMTSMITGASTSASTTQKNTMTSMTNGASTSASTTQNNVMTSMITGAFTPASTTQGNAMTSVITGASTSASTTQGNAMTSVITGASTAASETAETTMTTNEITPATTKASCPGFECDGIRCINKYYFCDDFYDCDDLSDEVTYNPAIHLGEGILCSSLTLLNTYCLLRWDQAHLESILCFDEKEETTMTTNETTPTTTEASCPGFKCDGIRCINKNDFCDDFYDCDDESDEVPYIPAIHSGVGISCASLIEPNTYCLLRWNQAHLESILCSNEKEENATTSTATPRTTTLPIQRNCTGKFKCLFTNECVDLEKFCDYFYDCSDFSDEVFYDPTYHTLEAGIECISKTVPSVSCLLPPNRIHLFAAVCKEEDKCYPGEFRCSDQFSCISKYWFCDGRNYDRFDCIDGSDEVIYDPANHSALGIPCRSMYSPERVCLLPNSQANLSSVLCGKDENCPPGEFKCMNKVGCIRPLQFCDAATFHLFDCSDGSDEILYDVNQHTSDDGIPCRSLIYLNRICLLPKEQSHLNTSLCKPNTDCPEYKCRNGERCVNKYFFCDDFRDCSDRSDEVIYNPLTTEGIPCTSWYFKDRSCLLRWDQAHLESVVCWKEKEETTMTTNETTPTTTEASCPGFKCDGIRCIDKNYFCDDFYDCDDLSDEVPYIPAEHSSRGISCASLTEPNRYCLLLWDQVHLESILCSNESNKNTATTESSPAFTKDYMTRLLMTTTEMETKSSASIQPRPCISLLLSLFMLFILLFAINVVHNWQK